MSTSSQLTAPHLKADLKTPFDDTRRISLTAPADFQTAESPGVLTLADINQALRDRLVNSDVILDSLFLRAILWPTP